MRKKDAGWSGRSSPGWSGPFASARFPTPWAAASHRRSSVLSQAPLVRAALAVDQQISSAGAPPDDGDGPLLQHTAGSGWAATCQFDVTGANGLHLAPQTRSHASSTVSSLVAAQGEEWMRMMRGLRG